MRVFSVPPAQTIQTLPLPAPQRASMSSLPDDDLPPARRWGVHQSLSRSRRGVESSSQRPGSRFSRTDSPSFAYEGSNTSSAAQGLEPPELPVQHGLDLVPAEPPLVHDKDNPTPMASETQRLSKPYLYQEKSMPSPYRSQSYAAPPLIVRNPPEVPKRGDSLTSPMYRSYSSQLLFNTDRKGAPVPDPSSSTLPSRKITRQEKKVSLSPHGNDFSYSLPTSPYTSMKELYRRDPDVLMGHTGRRRFERPPHRQREMEGARLRDMEGMRLRGSHSSLRASLSSLRGSQSSLREKNLYLLAILIIHIFFGYNLFKVS